MTLESGVDRGLHETNPPLESTFRRVTELILASDPRLTVYLKDGTVQFAFEGDLAAFVQPKANRVSLMFYRDAKIPGDFPHLEGDGPTARFISRTCGPRRRSSGRWRRRGAGSWRLLDM
jgi:hypothetical protein